MIKLESNMLVLDSTFSKEDVMMINEFVLQAERRAEDRIIKLLEEHTINAKHGIVPVGNSGWWERGMEYAIALIKGEK